MPSPEIFLILLGLILLCLTTTSLSDTARNTCNIIAKCRGTFAVAAELCSQSCFLFRTTLIAVSISLLLFLRVFAGAHFVPLGTIYFLRLFTICLNRLCSKLGVSPTIPDQIRSFMGYPYRAMVAALSGFWSGLRLRIHPTSPEIEFLTVAICATAAFRILVLVTQARTKPPITMTLPPKQEV